MLAPKLRMRAFTEWLMQQLLLLKITTGLSAYKDASKSIATKSEYFKG